MEQRRAFNHEREIADLAAVRSALEDAALALHRVGILPPSSMVTGPEVASVRSVAREEVEPALTRLVVRFGPEHPTAKAYQRCAKQLFSWRIEGSYPQLSQDEGGPAGKRREKHLAKMDRLVDEFEEASAEFLATAAKTAGAKLP